MVGQHLERVHSGVAKAATTRRIGGLRNSGTDRIAPHAAALKSAGVDLAKLSTVPMVANALGTAAAHTAHLESQTPVEGRHLHVEGKAQGVGFRFFAEQHANRLGLNGVVSNTPTGGVTTTAYGHRKSLDEFESVLRKGPDAAQVSSVKVSPAPVDPSIKHFYIDWKGGGEGVHGGPSQFGKFGEGGYRLSHSYHEPSGDRVTTYEHNAGKPPVNITEHNDPESSVDIDGKHFPFQSEAATHLQTNLGIKHRFGAAKWSMNRAALTVGKGDAGLQHIHELLDKADADPDVKHAEEMSAKAGDARDFPGVKDPDGRYSQKADAENQHVGESFINPASKPLPGEAPHAVFIFGKPGAGKTTMMRQMVKDGHSFPPLTMINADDVMEKIPGYSEETGGSNSYHERACDITRNYLTPQAIHGGYNVAFDATDNAERMAAQAKALKEAGYHVSVLHADVPDDVSAQRVYDRFKKTGRYVPLRVAINYHDKPKQAYESLKGIADEWKEYDTATNPPQVKDSGSRGQTDAGVLGQDRGSLPAQGPGDARGDRSGAEAAGQAANTSTSVEQEKELGQHLAQMEVSSGQEKETVASAKSAKSKRSRISPVAEKALAVAHSLTPQQESAIADSTTQLMAHPLAKVKGEAGAGDLFNKLKEYRRTLGPEVSDEKQLTELAEKSYKKQVEYQLRQEDPQAEFYTSQMDGVKAAVRDAYPEMAQPPTEDKEYWAARNTTPQEVMFHTASSVLSAGQSPASEIEAAMTGVWPYYKDNGKFPTDNHDEPLNHLGPRSPGMAQSLDKLNHLIEDKGGENGAAHFLLEKQKLADLKKYSPSMTPTFGNGAKESEKYGAYIVGPKIGSYILNKHGINDPVTMDSWMARSLRYIAGSEGMRDIKKEGLASASKGSGKLQDLTINTSERRIAHTAITELAHELDKRGILPGATPPMVQSMLWHHIRQLYAAHSNPTKDERMDLKAKEVAEHVKAARGESQSAGNEVPF